MAFEAIDIVRYVFYVLDFIFGVMSWGVTADRLKVFGGCGLNKANNLGQTAPCDAVIALGVIAMIALLVIIVLRSLSLFDTIAFPELIETISFGVLALIWFILAIVTVAVTDSLTRQASQVKTAIAGAWIAFLTHTGSSVISILAHRQGGKE